MISVRASLWYSSEVNFKKYIYAYLYRDILDLVCFKLEYSINADYRFINNLHKDYK